jgi:hypothetical protein
MDLVELDDGGGGEGARGVWPSSRENKETAKDLAEEDVRGKIHPSAKTYKMK